MANGLMTAVTIKSDKARLAMNAFPTPSPVLCLWCRRLRRCLKVTVVMTTKLPKVPTTAATPSTATYGAATTGLRLYNDRLWPTAASEPFISVSPVSGNSIFSNFAAFQLWLLEYPLSTVEDYSLVLSNNEGLSKAVSQLINVYFIKFNCRCQLDVFSLTISSVLLLVHSPYHFHSFAQTTVVTVLSSNL